MKTACRKLLLGPDGYEPPVSVCKHIYEAQGNITAVASEHQGNVSEMSDYLCEACNRKWHMGKQVWMYEILMSKLERQPTNEA